MGGYKHDELTGAIIASAHTVHNILGYGFPEKVYHNALLLELGKRGIDFESERHIDVLYDGRTVGQFAADVVVENKVIVELKAVEVYNKVFEAQILTYLKATGLEVGYVPIATRQGLDAK